MTRYIVMAVIDTKSRYSETTVGEALALYHNAKSIKQVRPFPELAYACIGGATFGAPAAGCCAISPWAKAVSFRAPFPIGLLSPFIFGPQSALAGQSRALAC